MLGQVRAGKNRASRPNNDMRLRSMAKEMSAVVMSLPMSQVSDPSSVKENVTDLTPLFYVLLIIHLEQNPRESFLMVCQDQK